MPVEWNDWQWQMRNRAKTLDDLCSFLNLTAEEKQAFNNSDAFFDFGASPYYLSIADKNDPDCPIRKQIVPSKEELIRSDFEREDPLAEETYMPVKGVTHRYPDRALWYLSHQCAVYCRFCTRKRKVGISESTPDKEEWEKAINYFKDTPSIKEVILSGGDPLSLSDNQLEYLIHSLKSIKHINQIRIHTRYPATLPYRITDNLCKIFADNFPLYMVTHFNHPKEITEDAIIAVKKLICLGNIILLNQSVLLSGINDSAETLIELNYKLISIGIKPYYLHQCDEVFGSSSFRVPIVKGKALMKQIRGHISGIAVPLYVADLTGGGGKVPIPTDYLLKQNAESYEFQNYKGDSYLVGL